MKKKTLIDAIGNIDDDFISEYEEYKLAKPNKKLIFAAPAIAACASIATIAGLFNYNESHKTSNSNNMAWNNSSMNPYITYTPNTKETATPDAQPTPSIGYFPEIPTPPMDTPSNNTDSNTKSFSGITGNTNRNTQGNLKQKAVTQDEDTWDEYYIIEEYPVENEQTENDFIFENPIPSAKAPEINITQEPAIQEPTESPNTNTPQWNMVTASNTEYDDLIKSWSDDIVSGNPNKADNHNPNDKTDNNVSPPIITDNPSSIPDNNENHHPYPEAPSEPGNSKPIVPSGEPGSDNSSSDYKYKDWCWFNEEYYSFNSLDYTLKKLPDGTEAYYTHMSDNTSDIGDLNILQIDVEEDITLIQANSKYCLNVFKNALVTYDECTDQEMYLAKCPNGTLYARILVNKKLITIWGSISEEQMLQILCSFY